MRIERYNNAMTLAASLKEAITAALKTLGLSLPEGLQIEHPADLSYGDYAANVALLLAKEAGVNPRELAERIVAALPKIPPTEKVEVAGPGFINFHLSQQFFVDQVRDILKDGERWGRNDTLSGKKVMVEYTDPNPFKEFHIGHLMSNAIGESVSRLVESSGAEVRRANYQGDVGLHVAKALWALMRQGQGVESAEELGKAYAAGAAAYEQDPQAKKEIDEINRKVYARSDKEINQRYDEGRALSLEHFEKIYKKLGTKFDFYFFESETGAIGKDIVETHKDVFEQSDGAIVFRGEKYGLHTRVFLTSEQLPTYEAKDLGLLKVKSEKYPFDISITVTAEEQKEYFKVVKEAMKQVFANLATKVVHITHGMMRLPSGKMSSRTGDVVGGESLLLQAEEEVLGKMRESDIAQKESVAEAIAVAAIKYSVLKQASGRDIIFNLDQALSFEGDSGPYLQYTHARILSLLEKAKAAGVAEKAERADIGVTDVEKLLYRFPEVVERAAHEYEPHYVTNYLIELAGAFNSWYGQERILDDTPAASYKLALAHATAITIHNGLFLLGIKAPERM